MSALAAVVNFLAAFFWIWDGLHGGTAGDFLVGVLFMVAGIVFTVTAVEES